MKDRNTRRTLIGARAGASPGGFLAHTGRYELSVLRVNHDLPVTAQSVDDGLSFQKNMPASGKTDVQSAASYGMGLSVETLSGNISCQFEVSRQGAVRNGANTGGDDRNHETRFVGELVFEF